ncbi:MAG: GDP-mannose 4,6-dehydratase [Alphaproteobacteria bacterium]|nr:GDP-mannose 4,6-dehydratase [Alphaproteobacteria bacterium]
MGKIALITGVTGQDGSFLAELLLEKRYTVYGMVRRTSVSNLARIAHSLNNDDFHLIDGDMTDSSSIMKAVSEVMPDEIYNLAGQSHVDMSFGVPEYTGEVDAMGVVRLLEAVKVAKIDEKVKIFQASASDMFGMAKESPQDENTPFSPVSPYAVAKLYGHWIAKEYRAASGMFIANGIMYNHESERRGENFVTRKITMAAVKIANGLQDHLELGNMDALRDWGYAKDYVECMWRILQQNEPNDFIMATGVQHSVRDFTKRAFSEKGIDLVFEGQGIEEKAYDKKTGKMLVCVNPTYFRPIDLDNLVGDPKKARKKLGWNPWNTPYEKMISIMVENDSFLMEKK